MNDRMKLIWETQREKELKDQLGEFNYARDQHEKEEYDIVKYEQFDYSDNS